MEVGGWGRLQGWNITLPWAANEAERKQAAGPPFGLSSVPAGGHGGGSLSSSLPWCPPHALCMVPSLRLPGPLSTWSEPLSLPEQCYGVWGAAPVQEQRSVVGHRPPTVPLSLLSPHARFWIGQLRREGPREAGRPVGPQAPRLPLSPGLQALAQSVKTRGARCTGRSRLRVWT